MGQYNGNIIIISGPSGAGEDSIIDGLSEILPVERVITTTTRKMRRGDSEGNPYYFISKQEFQKGIDEGKYFEWAEQYNGQYYGVTYDEIKRVQESGKLGTWKIEYKGVRQAQELIPGIPSIFINAPLDILEKRIRSREGISDEYVASRMEYTKEWLNHTDIYDYIVENEEGKLDEAIQKVYMIIDDIIGVDKFNKA